MDILYVLVSFVIFPTYLFVLYIMWLFKTLVFYFIKMSYGSRLEPMESADLYWAVGEKYHNLINIIMILNGKEGGSEEELEKDIKMVIRERLFKFPDRYGKLMCSLNTFLGYPFLVRENITANDIVNVIDVTDTNLKSMKDVLYFYSNKPMPQNDRLLWEIIVVKASTEWKRENNMKDHQIPGFIRINHTLADGLCVMNLCAHILGENDIDFDKSLRNIPRSPEWTQIPIVKTLQKALLFFIVPGYMIVEYFRGEMKERHAPIASNIHNVSYRVESKGEELLQTIKRLKKEIDDTSFSEIVLTAISASLHSFFQKNFHKVPKTISLAFVATRDLKPMMKNGVPALRNQFGMINMDVPITEGADSLLSRLKELKKNTRNLMSKPDLLIRNFITFNLLSILPIPVMKRVLPLNGAWSCISNLPELPKLMLFNGYELENAYFFTVQRDHLTTGFALITYDSRVHLGFMGDVAAVPTQEDCEEITNNVFGNIEKLKAEVQRRKNIIL